MNDRYHATTGPFADPLATALTYALDDEEEPTKITLFPLGSTDVTTAWITIDVEYAVDPLDVA